MWRARFFFAFLLLVVGLVWGKQDEREKRKDIVDMTFCGEDDCYAILNITADSTRGEVKRGYHKMSLQFHPDKVCCCEIENCIKVQVAISTNLDSIF